jgi:hypothetical protein
MTFGKLRPSLSVDTADGSSTVASVRGYHDEVQLLRQAE